MTRADSVAAARAHQAPVHFLFHSAFCASTLLCRALDHSGVAMGLSEPVLLNDVVGVRRRREMEGRDVGRLLDDSLTLLARGWGAGEAVILKPSCVVNPLGAGMLTLRPDAKALCLYAPLDQFLSSVARKELWCRLWVRELLEGLIGDGVVDLGFTPSDYFRLTDLQCAAVGWLAQHRLFAALAERFGADRVRTMDSEMLLTDPKAALAAIAGHFSLATSAGVIAAMADAPAFRRHSKSGESFDADARRAERTAAETAHGDELAKVHEWALVVAERAGVSIPLPHPLLQAS
ncbi:MAG: hypothetical protein ABL874_02110 [Sphingopyxis sp.]